MSWRSTTVTTAGTSSEFWAIFVAVTMSRSTFRGSLSKVIVTRVAESPATVNGAVLKVRYPKAVI